MPNTVTGKSEPWFVPSPSCPQRLSPQHWTIPEAITAQVWRRFVALILAPSETCATSVGKEVEFVVPSPISPSGFAPQHFRLPDCTRAQAWVSPADIWETCVRL